MAFDNAERSGDRFEGTQVLICSGLAPKKKARRRPIGESTSGQRGEGRLPAHGAARLRPSAVDEDEG